MRLLAYHLTGVEYRLWQYTSRGQVSGSTATSIAGSLVRPRR